ncbi:MAG: cupin domain-containing protein [Peptococcaceae bacterium]
MKVINIKQVPEEPVTGPLTTLFTSPVTMQGIIGKEVSSNFIITHVNFERGVRNKFHSHSNEQILIVTEGKGIVATENEEITVMSGDIIYIPAGEKHWHGAAEDSTFSHLYVWPPDTRTTQLED